MKVMTVLGTRPEIIRLSRVIARLDQLCEQILVHTGQNYHHDLNDVFMRELGVRKPDYDLAARGSFGEQIGVILPGCERIMVEHRPERLLVLGDTNSGLAAVMAKRLGIPVYHMEAGNRCYDDRVPEEVNRRIIDHSSDVLLPYTERSRKNLLREGIPGARIFVTGNPILEVIRYYEPLIKGSNALARLGLEARQYFLVTMHRAENVDVQERLRALVSGLELLADEYGKPVVCSLHPRTRDRMQRCGLDFGGAAVRWLTPLGFADFIALERNALCVLSDSGTVQEECCIFHVPNVTVRDVTERPETIECGSNMLSGADPQSMARCVRAVLDQNRAWNPPAEYLAEDVSGTVINILLGHLHPAEMAL
jgi:UDP-N-acetylglucosamine 2-epimerase (non-hydrolysing)